MWPPRSFAARLNAATVVVVLGVVVGIASAQSFALTRELWLIRGTGYAALAAFVLALAMTPAIALARRVPPLARATVLFPALRRSYGLCAAALGALHAAAVLLTYLRDAPLIVFELPFYRSGLLALTILGLLALTSFPPVVTRLRLRLWRHLHRLAYVAAALVFHHMLLAPFAPRRLAFAIFAGVLVLFALRWLPRAEPPRPESTLRAR